MPNHTAKCPSLWTRFLLAGALLVAAAFGLLPTRNALALPTDLYVDSAVGSDANPCSETEPCKTITQALGLAAEGATIHLAPGTYNRISGEVFPITIAESINIVRRGDTGSVIIDAAAAPGDEARIFVIASGKSVSLQNLTLQNGNAGGENGGAILASGVSSLSLTDVSLRANTAFHGGALYVTGGSLSLERVTFSGNAAAQDGGAVYKAGSGNLSVVGTIFGGIGNGNTARRGGAFFVKDSPLSLSGGSLSGNSAVLSGGALHAEGLVGQAALSGAVIASNSAGTRGGGFYLDGGSLKVSTSTLSGNNAANGAGIYLAGGTLTLERSLLRANEASSAGGGLALDGSGSVTVVNSTLSGNQAGSGAAVWQSGGTLNLESSTLAYNTGSGLAVQGGTAEAANSLFVETACSGGLTVDGYSLDSGSTCVSDTGRSQLDNLKLSALGNYGGPTYTHALLPGSAAIDAGDCTLDVDQRGFARPSGSACDVGAFESVPPQIGLAGTPLNYTEGQGALPVDANATFMDDALNYSGGTLRISLGETGQDGDLLSIASLGEISVIEPFIHHSSGAVPPVIGIFSVEDEGKTLSITLTNYATPERLQDLLRAITFENTSSTPSEEPRTVSFTLTDGAGASATASRQINVAEGNQLPTVSDFTRTLAEDTGLSFLDSNFINQFSDPDDDSLVKVKITALPAHGVLALSGVAVYLNQEITVDKLDDLTYTPYENYFGFDSFGWNASDGLAYALTPATVNLSITPVNDLPVVGDFGKSGVEDTVVAFTEADFTAVFSDEDTGDSLQSVLITELPEFGDLYLDGVIVALDEEIPVADLDKLEYRPDEHANGVDTFSWKGKDNNDYSFAAAVVTITLTAVNDAPVISAPATLEINEDSSHIFSGTISVTDPDAGELDLSLTLTATHGTLTLGAVDGLAVSGNGTGVVSVTGPYSALNAALNGMIYDPEADYYGSASLEIEVNDGGHTGNGDPVILSDTAAVAITIQSVNDAPVSEMGESASILEDAGEQMISLSGIAAGGGTYEDAQSLSVSAVSSDPALIPDVFDIAYDNETGTATVKFTPAADANGQVIISVTVQDDGGTGNGGVDSTTKDFTLTITPVNDAPSFTRGANQTVYEDAGPQTVTAWATDISTGPQNEASQTVTFEVSADNAALFAAGPEISPDGTLTYTPADDAYGSATITVVLRDDGGTENGGVDEWADTFTITVNPVNDAPSFVKGDDQSVDEDSGPQTVSNWATAISAGPANEITQVLTFTLTTDNDSLFAVGPEIAPDGTLSYTPADNAYGTANVSVTLMDDGGFEDGGLDTSLPVAFTITINAVNDAPELDDLDDRVINEDADEQIVSLSGISAGPLENQGLTVTAVSSAPGIVPDPSVTYTSPEATGTLTFAPAADAYGSATITVTVTDDNGTPDDPEDDLDTTKTFSVTVNPVNDAPTFGGSDVTVHEDENGGVIILPAWAGDISSGAENEDQTLTFDVAHNNGALFTVPPAVDPVSGDLSFTLIGDINGSATLTVTLRDDGDTANGGVNETVKTFDLTVTPVNDAPTFTAGPDQSVTEDSGPQTVAGWATDISAGPANEAAQELSFSLTTDADQLFSVLPAVDPATGNLTFTPAPNAYGVANVTATLYDDGPADALNQNASAPAIFTITITPVNDAPAITAPGTQSTNEDTTLVFSSSGGNRLMVVDDSGDGEIQVTLTATNGTFILNGETEARTTYTLNAPMAAVNAALNGLSFTPTLNYSGPASLKIDVNDKGHTGGGPDLTASKTVLITVNAVNDAPTLSYPAGPLTTQEDEDLAFSGVNQISAADLEAGSGHVQLNLQATNGTLSLGETDGLIFVVGDGSQDSAMLFSGTLANINTALEGLVFHPAADFNGEAELSITLDDQGLSGIGGPKTASATVAINVTAVNDAPSFVIPADLSVAEDAGPQTFDGWATGISAGPADEAGQALTFTLTTDNDSLFSVLPALSQAGDLTFTPAADRHGQVLVTVTLTDDGGTPEDPADDQTATRDFTLTITAVNDAPVLTGELFTLTAIEEDEQDSEGMTVWELLGPDGAEDADGELPGIAVTAVQADFGVWQYSTDDGAHWTDFGEVAEDNALRLSRTAKVRFVPDTDKSGQASFTLRLWDGTGLSNDTTTNGGASPFSAVSAQAQILVTAVNDAPVLVGSTAFSLGSISEDSSATVSVAALLASAPGAVSDVDEGAQYGVAITAAESSYGAWQYSLDDGQSWADLGPVSAAAARLLSAEESTLLRFTPEADFNGDVTLELRIWDRTAGVDGGSADVSTNGGTSAFSADSASALLTVTPVNDPPSFTKGVDPVVLEDSGSYSQAGWASGLSAGPTDESEQTLAFEITGNDNPALFSVGPSVSSTGELTFTPEPNAYGEANITLVLHDSEGGSSAPQAFTITVTPVNDAPVFTPGVDPVVDEDSSAQDLDWATGISAGPNESGQSLAFIIKTNDNPDLFAVPPTVSPDGKLSFTPAENAYGQAVITLVLVDDGGAENGGQYASDEHILTITVNPVNDTPAILSPAAVVTDENEAFAFAAEDRISVIDDAGSEAVEASLTAEHGLFSLSSAEGLTFTTGDGLEDATAVFTGTLTAINTALDGLVFTPEAGFNGAATLTLRVDDLGHIGPDGALALSAEETIIITVQAVNDAPTLHLPDAQTTLEDHSLAFDGGLWVSDIDAASDELELTLAVTQGTLSLSGVEGLTFTLGDGADDPALTFRGALVDLNAALDGLTYKPDPDYFGVDLLSVEVNDLGHNGSGGPLSDSGTVSIIVTPVNDAPAFIKGSNIVVQEDVPAQSFPGWATGISAGPVNESGQALSFIITENSNPTLFTVQPAVSAAGELTFTPAPDAFGLATIKLIVRDDGGTENGGQDSSPEYTFTIAVNSVNDAPVLVGETPLVLDDILEDTPPAENLGTAISDLLSGRMQDADYGDPQGVAVIAVNNSGGLWQYTTDGGLHWATFGTGVSESAARLLAAEPGTRIRFAPQANFNGVASLTLRGWDRSSGANGAVVEITQTGGTSAFSVETLVAQIQILSVNDAPTDISLSNTQVDENLDLGTVIGTFTTLDPDSSSFTYTLVAGEGDDDNGAFLIDGNELKTNAAVDFETQPSYTIRVQTDDGEDGGLFVKTFTLTVQDLNDAPTALNLSKTDIPENQPAGTQVGLLSTVDEDAGSSFTYALVAGEGDDDNSLFEVVGNALRTKVSFNYEVKNQYSIRLQTTDNGGATFATTVQINVLDVNEAPTAVNLSDQSVDEELPAGTTVGVLSADDEDDSEHTFTLVSGAGSENNASFAISGNELKTAAKLDYETKNSYSVRIRATDAQGLFIEQAFTVTVTNVNEAPVDVVLAPQRVLENQEIGTLVGTLETVDPDGETVFTYTLEASEGGDAHDNALFTIVGNELRTNAVFDYETRKFYTVRIQTADAHGGVMARVFTIFVDNANDAPYGLNLSASSLAERLEPGTAIGVFTALDQDAGDSHTYSLLEGEGDNAFFTIEGAELRSAVEFDYETQSIYTIHVQTTDNGGATYTREFEISITDTNDPPTDISLSASSLPENEPANTAIGQFTTTDQDAGDTFTYSLEPGVLDNDAFTIADDQLLALGSFDYEAKNSYSIQVQSHDGELSTQKVFTITVTDVNEAPLSFSLDGSSLPENSPLGSQVGVFEVDDPDQGGEYLFTLVAGEGDADNASFTIEGNALLTATELNFEVKNEYTIRVRLDDGEHNLEQAFTISITDGPDVPSDILLSNDFVFENLPQGTEVGTFSSLDEDGGTFTYALVEGEGDEGNAEFTIDGARLLTARAFNYELIPDHSFSIRVRTTDNTGLTFEKVFTISVMDVNDPPKSLSLTGSVYENEPAGTLVGSLSVTDEDEDAITYTLVAGGTHNYLFRIEGDKVYTQAVLNYEERSSYYIRVRADDGRGGTEEAILTIQVLDVNEGPTALNLSSLSLPENAGAGAVVGTLSTVDPDLADTHIYSLVSGEGDAGNAAFQVVGDELQAVDSLDYETQSIYPVRVRVTDTGELTYERAFTITVTDLNEAPTQINLSADAVDEKAEIGALVGTLSAVDPDIGDTHIFSLVTDADDNEFFTLSGDSGEELRVNAALDYSQHPTYTVRVQVTDSGGLTHVQQLTLNTEDINDAPTAIHLDVSSVDENQPVGTLVGSLSATDPDLADVHSFSLVEGEGDDHNALFTLDGVELLTNAVFDFEAGQSYSVRLRAEDGRGGSFEQALTITINDVNETPSAPSLTGDTLPENAGAGALVGTLSADDPDAGDSLSFSLVEGEGDADNAAFQIAGNELQAAGSLDFETQNTFSVRVRVTDSGGLYAEQAFTITVTDVNEAPVSISLSSQSLPENAGAGALVGMLSADDPDAGDSLSFSLVEGEGDADNAAFQIAGNELQAVDSLDHETRDSYSVRVRATDSGGLYTEQAFTITVIDVNEAPTQIYLDNQVLPENSGANAEVGTLSAEDPDEGDIFTFSVDFAGSPDDNAAFTIDGHRLLAAINLDYESKFIYNITIRVTDAGGLTLDVPFTITVTDGDEPPTVSDLSFTLVEDGSLAFQATDFTGAYTDEENSPAVSVKITRLPVHGALTLDGAPVNAGDEIAIADLNGLVYQPEADFFGEDSFGWNASDGAAYALEDASASLQVTPVNDRPVMDALSDLTLNEDAGQQTIALQGISAGPYETDSLTITASSSNPGLIPHPTVTYAGTGATASLRFTPQANASGEATITITLDDGQETDNESTYTFNVTVLAVNDAPTFTKGTDPVVVDQDTGPHAIPWAKNISAGPGESGQSLSFSLTNDNPSLFSQAPAIDPDGVLTFTPAPGKIGKATLTVTLRDDGGTERGGQDSSSAVSFEIQVRKVNHAPQAQNDAATTWQDSPVLIPVGANDSDSDGDSLTVTAVTQPAHGTTQIVSGGVRYTPAKYYIGTDSFTYTVRDPGGLTATATVTVQVRAIESAVQPNASGSLTYTAPDGDRTVVNLPKQSVEQPVTLVYTAQDPSQPAQGLLFAGTSFTLEVYRDGQRLDNYSFARPITIELHYSNADVAGIDESTLVLYYWDPVKGQWVDAAQTCNPASGYERNLEQNWIRVQICHLTEFALFAKPAPSGPAIYQVLIPLVNK